MKRIVLIFIVFSAINVTGQNTWVQKLSYSMAMQGYFDVVTGIRNIEIGSDGSVYVCATVRQVIRPIII